MGATLSLDGNNNIASSSDNHKEKRKCGRTRKLRPQEGGDSNRQITCVINSSFISRGETSENPAVTKGPIICPVWSGKNAFFPGSEEANVLPAVDTALPRITATAEEKQMGMKMMESMSKELPMLELKSCDNTLCNNAFDSDSGQVDNGVPNAENDAAKTNTEEQLEIQLKLTLRSQEGDHDSHEGMDDIMKVCASEGVASATIGASVFHMFHNFDDMDLEGISSADPSGMRARQYSVKASLVPTLNAIIEKHGDIAQDCPLTSGDILTNILERVCQAVEDLGALPFSKLHISVLKSIYSTVSDAELLKLNVKWLRDRCDELVETVSGIRKYKSLKSDIKEHTTSIKYKKTAIELKRTEMMKLQSEIQSLENEVASMTEKTEELEKTMSSVKSKCSYFRHNSLVNGLL
ncbi:Phospholipase-like protein [Corchorus olitorius]|uniref:Phospholipase-like protein n=1 Tax=Corchorus olitorius TaxID=93759 RepID=A0A1R3JBW1_9ROSI|nr:Phospholipase-like protein [Corchorus olitorius]